jgi:hypothetical protein
MKKIITSSFLFLKIFSAICGFNTIDLHKEETNAYWDPIKQNIKLDYHKNELNKVCLIMLENMNDQDQWKHYIKKIIEDIDNNHVVFQDIDYIIQLQMQINAHYINNVNHKINKKL